MEFSKLNKSLQQFLKTLFLDLFNSKNKQLIADIFYKVIVYAKPEHNETITLITKMQ